MPPFPHNESSHDDEALLTSEQAASLLGVTRSFLVRDRWQASRTGKGPEVAFVMIGTRTVRYRLFDLKAYVRANRVARAEGEMLDTN